MYLSCLPPTGHDLSKSLLVNVHKTDVAPWEGVNF